MRVEPCPGSQDIKEAAAKTAANTKVRPLAKNALCLSVLKIISNSFRATYAWEVVIGHWALVVGHWASVNGHWSSVIGHQSSVIGHWASVIIFLRYFTKS
jgi:hypothetical protein